MAIREKRNTGPEGMGIVKVLKDKVRIDLDDGGVYEIPLTGVPGAANGKFRVSINKDKTKAFLHPIPGQYILSFHQFGARVAGVPTVRINRGGPRKSKTGGTWMAPDEQVFVASFTIESENIYNGLEVTTSVPFAFAPPQSGEACDFYDSKRNLSRIEQFLRVAGGVENLGMFEVPYSPDPSVILMWLERYIQKKELIFTGTVGERGFLEIESLASIAPELLPKKGMKKAAKKK